MSLYYITSNKNKFAEVQAILGNVQQLDMDLPEIQEVDAKAIIEAKLGEALQYANGPCIVEDTSLYLDCLGSLPGPLIKWFLKTIGNEGLVRLAVKLGNNKASAKTIIGYAKNPHQVAFFEGITSGRIVSATGTDGFGWDQIFQPDGYNTTFAGMSADQKNHISMRKIAVEKLRDFLAPSISGEPDD